MPTESATNNMSFELKNYTVLEISECRRCRSAATLTLEESVTSKQHTICFACGYGESWMTVWNGHEFVRHDHSHWQPAGAMMYKRTRHTNTEFEALNSETDVTDAERMLRVGVRDGSIDADSVRLRVWNTEMNEVETILCPHVLDDGTVNGS